MPTSDFQQIITSPVTVYQEGLRFFMGEGVLNETLRRVAQDLENHSIEYIAIGAVTLNSYGYRCFTEDIRFDFDKRRFRKISK